MAIVSVQWWGVQIGLTHDEAIQAESGEVSNIIDSIISGMAGWAAWWLPILVKLWFFAEAQWMKAVDRGNGVYLNLAWWPTIAWWQWWMIFPTTR
jgi:hypothetical protein